MNCTTAQGSGTGYRCGISEQCSPPRLQSPSSVSDVSSLSQSAQDSDRQQSECASSAGPHCVGSLQELVSVELDLVAQWSESVRYGQRQAHGLGRGQGHG